MFNVWVQILFEQGWVGVVALTVAVLMSLRRLAIGMWRGDLFSATLLAALDGFLLIGLTESLFDGSPRDHTLLSTVVPGMVAPIGRCLIGGVDKVLPAKKTAARGPPFEPSSRRLINSSGDAENLRR